QREEVHLWLKELVEIYPKARFIVTGRPYALEEDWVKREGFDEVGLQPMDLADIRIFIDHWHAAVAEEVREEEDKADLVSFAEHLKLEIERDPSKRNLATNPLLCAMLCALNRERHSKIPSDRIELCEACCNLLIERRDKDRR